MKRELVFAIMLAMAGCVQPATTDGPSTLREEQAGALSNAGATNESTPILTPTVTLTLISEPTTRAESAQFAVNASAPVALVIQVDGNETVREAMETSRTVEVPLAFGQNNVVLQVSASGFAQASAFEVVRLAATTIQIDYGVFHPSSQGMPRTESFELWIDVDSRPAAEAYAQNGAQKFDAFTAHDQLVVFEATTGTKIEYEYFASFQGFSVNRIDGAGSPLSSSAPPWWCYTLNAAAADGISVQPVAPGDVVAWTLGSC